MDDFDEAAYLRQNPDVAAAVEAGAFASGREHYERHGRAEGRAGIQTDNRFVRFEQRAPSAQTATDVFRGQWVSDLGHLLSVTGTGRAALFQRDWALRAARTFGLGDTLDGMDVLDMGPLEGGHTYQLERLGARSVTAVEASVMAYLKCLIVKEELGLTRSRFLLGDVIEYLAAEPRHFDMIVCSGILYHMADPLELVRAMAEATDRCLVWSHYFDPEIRKVEHRGHEHVVGGFAATYWMHDYEEKTTAFLGGNQPLASWLERDAMLAAFRHFGFGDITVLEEDRLGVNGPWIMFCAGRPRGS